MRAAGAEGEDHVETYHDRIRETILARLTPSEREATHQRLALALETSPVLDPESLAVHYEAAGAPERAAAYAADAAAKAADALAFDRAARLYRVALELGTADEVAAQKLRVGLGDALANAGRGAEAARAYLAAADRAQSTENLELQRRAAEQLCRAVMWTRGFRSSAGCSNGSECGFRSRPGTPSFASVASRTALDSRTGVPRAHGSRDSRRRPDAHRHMLVRVE